MPRVEQSFAHMRPDKPSATCDQKIHRSGCYVSELAQVEMRLESNGHAKCRRDWRDWHLNTLVYCGLYNARVAAAKTPQLRLWVDNHEGFARLCIEDNGIGVPSDYAKKAFGIFERLHP